MTLILSAIYKNGICVCADKRHKITNGGKSIIFEDNHNKIYKFNKIPLIISNHGINRIKNKGWEIFCSDYEKSNRWTNKNLFEIVNDFKNFIENDVIEELNIYKDGRRYVVGFLLCGKTSFDTKFKINELCWSIDSDGMEFEILRHRGLVMSGSGQKCLNTFLKDHQKLNTESYWKSLDLTNTERELKKIFAVAVKEKILLGIDEFSDDPDIEYVGD